MQKKQEEFYEKSKEKLLKNGKDMKKNTVEPVGERED